MGSAAMHTVPGSFHPSGSVRERNEGKDSKKKGNLQVVQKFDESDE